MPPTPADKLASPELPRRCIVEHKPSPDVCLADLPLSSMWVVQFFEFGYGKEWSLEKLVEVYRFDTVKKFWCMYNNMVLDENLCGSIYMMRDGISPRWEDKSNMNGGYWILRCPKDDYIELWNDLVLNTIGETLCNSNLDIINGIELTPKPDFMTIKIWINDSKYGFETYYSDNAKYFRGDYKTSFIQTAQTNGLIYNSHPKPVKARKVDFGF